MPTKHMVKNEIPWEIETTESGTFFAHCSILDLNIYGDSHEDVIAAAEEVMELFWESCEEDGDTLRPT